MCNVMVRKKKIFNKTILRQKPDPGQAPGADPGQAPGADPGQAPGADRLRNTAYVTIL